MRRKVAGLTGLGLMLAAALFVVSCSREAVHVTIPPGSTMREVSDSLKRAGLVSIPRLFRVYAKLGGRDRDVRPGTFVIARNSSWGTILDSLTRGRGEAITVTIPEGYTLAAIESLLVGKLHLSSDSVAAAARDSAILERLGVPTATLEGYLFPDTYSFSAGSPARMVVKTMTDRFEATWDSSWTPRLDSIGMSRHEVISLASIIEREAIVAAERPVISAVYHNRLRIGMPLQADPTVQYAKGQHSDRVYLKDLDIVSPYNTYRNAGLPPGPIASPGRLSIRAALYPADVRYLYFVAHPDGHHEFRNTYAEHLEAKQTVQRIRSRNGSSR